MNYEQQIRKLAIIHGKLRETHEVSELTEEELTSIYHIMGIEDHVEWELDEQHVGLFLDGMQKGYKFGITDVQ